MYLVHDRRSDKLLPPIVCVIIEDTLTYRDCRTTISRSFNLQLCHTRRLQLILPMASDPF